MSHISFNYGGGIDKTYKLQPDTGNSEDTLEQYETPRQAPVAVTPYGQRNTHELRFLSYFQWLFSSPLNKPTGSVPPTGSIYPFVVSGDRERGRSSAERPFVRRQLGAAQGTRDADRSFRPGRLLCRERLRANALIKHHLLTGLLY